MENKKLIYLEDAIAKIVNTPSAVAQRVADGEYGHCINSLTALADRQFEIINRLEEVPVVAKTVHGRWIKQWHDNSLIGHMYEECSICGCMISDYEKFWDCGFCPNCGSTMDGKHNVPREDVEE